MASPMARAGRGTGAALLGMVAVGCLPDAGAGEARGLPGAGRFGSERAHPSVAAAPEEVWADLGGGPRVWSAQRVGEEAVFEGDILLGAAPDLVEGAEAARAPAAAVLTARAWPGARIPYAIDPRVAVEVELAVEAAVAHWNEQTLVQLTPWAGEPDHLRFEPGEGCASYLGRRGGAQPVSLALGCGRGAVIHEIGHAVGLFHEQSRADRDRHVEVLWNNVAPGFEGNFATWRALGEPGQDLGPYDLGSIMHYGGYAFGEDPYRPTIVTRVDRVPVEAQRDGLSTGDRAAATERALAGLDVEGRVRWVRVVHPASGRCLSGGGRLSRCPEEGAEAGEAASGATRLAVADPGDGAGVLLVGLSRYGCLRPTEDAWAAEGAPAEGIPVRAGACDRSMSGRWAWTAGGQLRHLRSGDCLRPTSDRVGAHLRLGRCDGRAVTGWQITDVERR